MRVLQPLQYGDWESILRESPAAAPLLRVDGLAVRFGTDERPLDAVDHATLGIRRGETVCLVGESGSGKTVTALSILRLDEHRRARIVRGDILFDGRSLVGLPRAELDRLRGQRIAMVFQEPMTAFDPVFTIGDQIVETILRHEKVSRRAAFERGVQLLERVHIPEARLRMRQIPQQLSGGMRQRAMIAMALACGPELLIADEPTTALDVTIQAQILALLKELQQADGMAVLLITHDLGVAAEVADRVVVMYAGRVVEQAAADVLLRRPGHPYTRCLLRSAVPLDSVRGSRLAAIPGSIPRLDALPGGCRFHPRCALADARCGAESPPLEDVAAHGSHAVACWHAFAPDPAPTVVPLPVRAPAQEEKEEASARPAPGTLGTAVAEGGTLVETVRLSKHFATGRGPFSRGAPVRALDDVSLAIRRGETFGLVGESGCGKSTLGRLLMQLETPTRGEVRFAGRPLHALRGAARRQVRREMQMIFQDPYSAIDPRWTVGDVIAEPLVAQGERSRDVLHDRVVELLGQVGLNPAARHQHVHEFSGGQRQRIGIARAIALEPSFVLADEAVSALDLSVQAQIINLFAELRDRLALTTLFIGHGLNVVRHLSHRIGVMYLGRLVEVAPSDELFRRPAHHYTQALLSAIPSQDPQRRRAAVAPVGELPSPTAPPAGCHFHPRCPAATDRCRSEAPALAPITAQRWVACHFPR
ncbi:ABC transporter ATP-binding protein [Xylophilus sp.]|uniref:ABC transporter ATP-binding protein n=1 Tax=Xylophilus sp. TaxID=2653893 RepID=UPI002D8021DC|nr:ABC transporter ATP-binding protein [Xylophilus sp.]